MRRSSSACVSRTISVNPRTPEQRLQPGFHAAARADAKASRVRWRRCDGSRCQRGCRRAGHPAAPAGPGGCPEASRQGQYLACDLGPHGARLIAIVDLAVTLQPVDDGKVRRGLAVRTPSALQHPPALRAVRMHNLVHERTWPTPASPTRATTRHAQPAPVPRPGTAPNSVLRPTTVWSPRAAAACKRRRR